MQNSKLQIQNATAPTLAEIEAVAVELMDAPQVPMPVTHRFAPGVYTREIFMPAGTFVIGHLHKTEHFNVVLTGKARVFIDGQVSELQAPAVFVSAAGVQKLLLIEEDMQFVTVHPLAGLEACGQNIEQLEAALVSKPAAYWEKLEMLKSETLKRERIAA